MSTAEEIREILYLNNLTKKSDTELQLIFSGDGTIPGFKDEIKRITGITEFEVFKKSVRAYDRLETALHNLKLIFSDKEFSVEIEKDDGSKITFEKHDLEGWINAALHKLSHEFATSETLKTCLNSIEKILKAVIIAHPTLISGST